MKIYKRYIDTHCRHIYSIRPVMIIVPPPPSPSELSSVGTNTAGGHRAECVHKFAVQVDIYLMSMYA